MQQVLFTIPFFKGSFPPDGIPMYGFGAMLFVCFVAVTVWGSRRAKRTANMPPERFQDMVIWLFVSGLVGARTLYMIQYSHHFPDQSIAGLIGAFFKIWEGGIIFYGSALGGVIGYGLFYYFVLRRLDVSGWRLADAVAPLLALGLAIGRIGCYLNGCCWGQVACEECRPVPLGAAHFPMLPAHARQLLVREQHLQTATGFTIEPRQVGNPFEDPRAVVASVETDSAADRAGVKSGDRITKVNDRPNYIVIELSGSDEKAQATADAFKAKGAEVETGPGGRLRVLFDSFEKYRDARLAVFGGAEGAITRDYFDVLVSEWPRGRSELKLTVERGAEQPELRFAPATIGLYPTQLYETVSMVLLILLLVAYYPYRRHDGQVMVLLMVGYAIHRFINESLRIEPTIGGGLTLSQWGSVVIFAAAVGIEAYLWLTMPSRWSGQLPPDEPATHPNPGVAPAQ
ncbi:prolipoprotein diacylglyceryl transferase : Prolipoprotein diacylglyceryl transferase OS=Pirellula staleyi (strain ATCC 27377 / DSM 6068 / ICPB 4128) GN=Psta_2025 PE=4 SV=1: LGT: PDZ [Gemmata massiliana]|uniref:Phosphatidylglycerol--prolipoprotein diacylglyceryl transferase n=1 Tax=Gemmata massiliana TaxID=1210884 RepID=A0A6P2CRR5_9BACT|nr:prolipoprotein diacylglyceryl transferase family protein [Gemmata massiliana]VTR91788.1 prolipoprotein diacylglyceryl transferase : Prolipoprotein diacylglyceryl transferase OS=Pirellula staleyi (strain ATCC 27377 / DSM 6068 / ICPB 4128) GN=Psta_2025 PE=4 SV=1: LGT: PDZ [Gemmata massiliana]